VIDVDEWWWGAILITSAAASAASGACSKKSHMRDDPRNYLNDFPKSKNRQNNHAEKQWHKTTQVYVEHVIRFSSLQSVSLIGGMQTVVDLMAISIAICSSSVRATNAPLVGHSVPSAAGAGGDFFSRS
jgi:hypothetical protein